MWVASYDIAAESWRGKPFPEDFALLYVVGWVSATDGEIIRGSPNICDIENLFSEFFENNMTAIYRILESLLSIELAD